MPGKTRRALRANRVRSRHRATENQPPRPAARRIDHPGDGDDAFTAARRRSWARLLQKIFEVDPMTCPRCLVPMTVVSVITDPKVVDQILAHLRRTKGRDPFEPRAPPDPLAKTA
jgi:hypothetical protein